MLHKNLTKPYTYKKEVIEFEFEDIEFDICFEFEDIEAAIDRAVEEISSLFEFEDIEFSLT